MIRMIVAFLLVFAAFYFGIKAYRQLTNKEKLKISELLIYSSTCALLAVGSLAALVVLF